MKKKIAVVLLSGGMDSCVTTAIANEKYELALLHLNYKHRTEKRELKAFNDIANFYKAKHRLIVDINYFQQIGNSSLTDISIEVSIANLKNKNIPASYVPFRYGNFLAMATSWGEVIGAKKIFIGAVEEDSSGYPDCRKKFLKQFNNAINEGTKPTTKIKIITPVIDLKKYEIVKKGIFLKAPLNLTWSCYKEEKIACGICDSCALRLRGFQIANIKDPIKYKTVPNYI